MYFLISICTSIFLSSFLYFLSNFRSHLFPFFDYRLHFVYQFFTEYFMKLFCSPRYVYVCLESNSFYTFYIFSSKMGNTVWQRSKARHGRQRTKVELCCLDQFSKRGGHNQLFSCNAIVHFTLRQFI